MDEKRLITCVIDGKEARVPEGTLLIEAAASVGILIPRFCYHRLLKPYGGCRMCLVDIVTCSAEDPRPTPRPQPACMVEVQEGMVVDTQGSFARNRRKAILEFTLINHPLDCPVCDKGGECDLQDLTYLYGPEDSRFREKKIANASKALSSLVLIDYNRCIQCKRCVRWTEEIADDDRLVFVERGARTRVATFNGTPFVSRFAGMTIELCPVGALTSTVFRFKARAWELDSTNSTCVECGLGCAMTGQTRAGRVMRLISREDPRINGGFFCDRGRFAHDWLDNPDRIVSPLVRSGDGFKLISWEDAAELFAREFKKPIQMYGPRSVAACIHPSETLETLWSFGKLFRDIFGTPRIEHAPAPLGVDPDDSYALFSRLASVDSVLTSRNLVLWDSDPFDEVPVLGLRLKLAREKAGINGISVTSCRTWLGTKGLEEHVVQQGKLPLILAGVATSFADQLERIPAELEDSVEAARRAAGTMTRQEAETAQRVASVLSKADSVLVVGAPVLRFRRRELAALLLCCVLSEAVTGRTQPVLPIFRHANALPALLFGLRTQLLTGPGPGLVNFTGESVVDWPKEVERGKLNALFAAGDGLIEMTGRTALSAFDRLEFLAVVTDFMTPLARKAHLVLPRLSPFENSGTVVTLDGHLRRLERLVEHPAGAWPLERFFAETARAMGYDMPVERSEIRKEIASSVSALSALADRSADFLMRPARARLRLADSRHAFEMIEPLGSARFSVIVAEPVFQHDSRGLASPHLSKMPEDFACGMNREDASRLGLKPGDSVRILGEPGELTARIKIVDVPKEHVLLYIGFLDHPLAELGIWANPDTRVAVEKLD